MTISVFVAEPSRENRQNVCLGEHGLVWLTDDQEPSYTEYVADNDEPISQVRPKNSKY